MSSNIILWSDILVIATVSGASDIPQNAIGICFGMLWPIIFGPAASLAIT